MLVTELKYKNQTIFVIDSELGKFPCENYNNILSTKEKSLLLNKYHKYKTTTTSWSEIPNADKITTSYIAIVGTKLFILCSVNCICFDVTLVPCIT